MAQSPALPVVFVVDRDPVSLARLESDLSRRFGNSYRVVGEPLADAAIDVLHDMAVAGVSVAVLLVDDGSTDLLARAHELHPQAKRVLLVNRDYSATSPAVQAMTLGRVDYHVVRPWANEEMLYGPMSEYLSAWAKDRDPSFHLFRIVAEDGDARVLQLRDVMTRFTLPFALYSADSDEGRRLLADSGLDGTRLPAVIRYDGKAV